MAGRALAVGLLGALLLAPGVARAEREPAAGFVPRLALETGRLPFLDPEPGLLRLTFHGEYQLRLVGQTDLRLQAPASDPAAGTLGQTSKAAQWLRITPHFQITDVVELIGQVDVLRGLAFGATTRYVGAALDPEDEPNPVSVDPRWLYAEVRTGIGLFRVGQQPTHFGMGIVSNDGDHPSLFGDYRRGDASERLLFSTHPGGKASPLEVFVAGDLVFRDQAARLTEGDRAWQGLAGFTLGSEINQIGGLVMLRHQRREPSGNPGPLLDRLDARTIDLHGRFAVPVPGAPAHLFGEAEAAVQWGEVSQIRAASDEPASEGASLRAFGAAARVGVVGEESGPGGRYGSIVGARGWGYASGDSGPTDGTTRRFTMNPSFQVGLLLFSQVLHWKSARSATLVRDPALADRPAPGLNLQPTNGGVAGATYVNPTLVVRPRRWLDLKLGAVLAQATSDRVDPYRFVARGQIASEDGGAAGRRDLGLELDGGFEARIPLDFGMNVQLGAQVALLLPGHAFDDEAGGALGTQRLVVGRFGFQY
jgi:hypothetical protein